MKIVASVYRRLLRGDRRKLLAGTDWGARTNFQWRVYQVGTRFHIPVAPFCITLHRPLSFRVALSRNNHFDHDVYSSANAFTPEVTISTYCLPLFPMYVTGMV
jgi:hypothetical protein